MLYKILSTEQYILADEAFVKEFHKNNYELQPEAPKEEIIVEPDTPQVLLDTLLENLDSLTKQVLALRDKL